VGPRVNKAFLAALVAHPAFRAGGCDTGFIARHLDELLDADPAVTAAAVAHAVALLLERERQRIAAATAIQTLPSGQPWHDPWSTHDGFALGPPREVGLDILVDGAVKPAEVAWGDDGLKVRLAGAISGATAPDMTRTIAIEGGLVVLSAGRQHLVSLIGYDRSDANPHNDDGVLVAPMNGRVVAVLVEAGQAVKKGDRLILMEAMKMEHALVAPFDGVVAELTAAAGDPAAEGAALVRVAETVTTIEP
jgi:3-methylcrotonyl-CoA carboxylase alpha subunit